MCNCTTCQCIAEQVKEQRNNVATELVEINSETFVRVSDLKAMAERWYATGHYMAVSCATELCKYIESHT